MKVRALLGILALITLWLPAVTREAGATDEPGRLTAVTAPRLNNPPNGTLLQNMSAITLSFELPEGTTQYQHQ